MLMNAKISNSTYILWLLIPFVYIYSMREGIIKKVDFDTLASPDLNIVPNANAKRYYLGTEGSNCSTGAISLLTGLSIQFIDSLNPGPSNDYWYIEDVVKFLRQRDFKVVEVTKRNVTNIDSWKDGHISANH